MNYDFALLASDKRVKIKNYKNGSFEEKILDLSELEDLSPLMCLCSNNIITDETKSFLKQQSQFFPIRTLEDLNLSENDFNQMSFEELSELANQVSSSWTLNNNLIFLQEFIRVLKHLRALWPNDRTTFFEELWFIMKHNLNAQDFKIIYNDLSIDKNKDKEDKKEKQKLIRIQITGHKTPQPVPGDDLCDKFMDHYKDEFHQSLNVVEFIPQRHEFVLASNINKSPILLMGRALQLSQIQVSLFTALFDGLQEEAF